jgi:hypothetical protein
MATQYLVPSLAGAAYFGIFRKNIASGLFRKSPYYGIIGIILYEFRWFWSYCIDISFMVEFESFLRKKGITPRRNYGCSLP